MAERYLPRSSQNVPCVPSSRDLQSHRTPLEDWHCHLILAWEQSFSKRIFIWWWSNQTQFWFQIISRKSSVFTNAMIQPRWPSWINPLFVLKNNSGLILTNRFIIFERLVTSVKCLHFINLNNEPAILYVMLDLLTDVIYLFPISFPWFYATKRFSFTCL